MSDDRDFDGLLRTVMARAEQQVRAQMLAARPAPDALVQSLREHAGALRNTYQASLPGDGETPHVEEANDPDDPECPDCIQVWMGGEVAAEVQPIEGQHFWALAEAIRDGGDLMLHAALAIEELRAERDAGAEQVRRARRAAQTLIEVIGASGPESAEETAQRAARTIGEQRAELEGLRESLALLLGDRSPLGPFAKDVVRGFFVGEKLEVDDA